MLGILAWMPNPIAVTMIVFIGAIIASYVGTSMEKRSLDMVTGGRTIGLAVELLIHALVFNSPIRMGLAPV
jgi:hypothetical protein